MLVAAAAAVLLYQCIKSMDLQIEVHDQKHGKCGRCEFRYWSAARRLCVLTSFHFEERRADEATSFALCLSQYCLSVPSCVRLSTVSLCRPVSVSVLSSVLPSCVCLSAILCLSSVPSCVCLSAVLCLSQCRPVSVSVPSCICLSVVQYLSQCRPVSEYCLLCRPVSVSVAVLCLSQYRLLCRPVSVSVLSSVPPGFVH